jgi:hypothetical protein
MAVTVVEKSVIKESKSNERRKRKGKYEREGKEKDHGLV